MNVTEIINTKGSEVVSLSPTATIDELLKTLTAKKIGAVVVLDGDHLVGIVSERDIVRFVNHSGDLAGPVSSIMSTTVWTCKADDDIRQIATAMTNNRIRHLPVLDECDRVVAIVSIGDVVKARLDDLEAERDHLETFVHGRREPS